MEFRSDMTVELVQSMGNDLSVVMAARISTGNDARPEDPNEIKGLIEFLMRNRHGTPFEHNAFTFRIEAPIFVWREFHRHRIGFSYNEESSRYKQLEPVFYVPDESRNLVQTGKPGQYIFQPGTYDQLAEAREDMFSVYELAYKNYEKMLADGIAREVARTVLPVAIYSSCYVTCNARSLMSFLSLRTKSDIARFPSFPQREIEMVANYMEYIWAMKMPMTARAFHDFGRVSP